MKIAMILFDIWVGFQLSVSPFWKSYMPFFTGFDIVNILEDRNMNRKCSLIQQKRLVLKGRTSFLRGAAVTISTSQAPSRDPTCAGLSRHTKGHVARITS